MKERIRKHADNMSVPYALKNYIKFNQLENEIKRNIKRELNGDNTIQFDSQDLRYFIIQLEKTHRAMNRIVNFSKFQKRFDKYQQITGDTLKEETLQVCKYIGCASELQRLYSLLNYDATLLYFIELQKQQQKESNDQYFNKELTNLLKNLC